MCKRYCTGCLGFVAIKTGDIAETNDQEIMENGTEDEPIYIYIIIYII